MSTRCTITVHDDRFGEHEEYTIYRHCDGYPDSGNGVLHTLSEALPYAWPLPRFEAVDFAAAIIAAWKNGGGNIYCSRGHDYHHDTDYRYNVRMRDGCLVVDWNDCYPNDDGERETGTHVLWQPSRAQRQSG